MCVCVCVYRCLCLCIVCAALFFSSSVSLIYFLSSDITRGLQFTYKYTYQFRWILYYESSSCAFNYVCVCDFNLILLFASPKISQLHAIFVHINMNSFTRQHITWQLELSSRYAKECCPSIAMKALYE